ncbi:putative mycofactocin biosynthesis transcriptional regulator MftR [Rhodococcus sp. RD6.2]|uniref:mycofactocin system transcriptional regulator n=1 Tax=Rhodococcus sp. RD6.2 TaxID=260936 RepID=UPI00063B2EEA|nr:mycofactocin system transcriptional regulator [Rhodococcus sp. RD6.2]CRK52720.1 putative mycofactocin biosynthesis transcriptional regulator MftR [Rhodococcus sp. RD6.2]
MAGNSRSEPVRIGRRPSTTPDRISSIAIALFAEQGFEETSVDQIAEAAGIARRTFFRYFPSKNAVPWGDFDTHLSDMREQLANLPGDISLADGLTRALLEFNRFPPDIAPIHRKRMEVILNAPALQAYSMVMYTGWRDAIAEYVAARLGCRTTDHLPRTVGWLVLGTALAAYEQWLTDESLELSDLLRAGSAILTDGLTTLPATTDS